MKEVSIFLFWQIIPNNATINAQNDLLASSHNPVFSSYDIYAKMFSCAFANLLPSNEPENSAKSSRSRPNEACLPSDTYQMLYSLRKDGGFDFWNRCWWHMMRFEGMLLWFREYWLEVDWHFSWFLKEFHFSGGSNLLKLFTLAKSSRFENLDFAGT